MHGLWEVNNGSWAHSPVHSVTLQSLSLAVPRKSLSSMQAEDLSIIHLYHKGGGGGHVIICALEALVGMWGSICVFVCKLTGWSAQLSSWHQRCPRRTSRRPRPHRRGRRCRCTGDSQARADSQEDWDDHTMKCTVASGQAAMWAEETAKGARSREAAREVGCPRPVGRCRSEAPSG